MIKMIRKRSNSSAAILIMSIIFLFVSSLSTAEDVSTTRVFYADSCITDADNWQYSYIVGNENSYAASPDIQQWIKDIDPAAIRQVSISSDHFLVLLDDNSVLAYGNNDDGQCNTQDWKCTSIRSDVMCSYGISTDGTILYCGIEDDNGVKDWKDIVQLSVDYSVVGRNHDGVAFFSNNLTITPPKDVREIITNGLKIAWLNTQGRVFVEGIDRPKSKELEWTNVNELAFACTNFLCGLDAKGKLLLYGFPNKEVIQEKLKDVVIEHIFRNGLIDKNGNIYLFDLVYTPRLIDKLSE